jgi:TPR repeat protein
MYLLGIGINQDDSKAFRWFTESANQGDSEAQTFL